MPAWVTDESRWEKAKKAAGKSTSEDSEDYWKLSNYIYHKMGKTEEDEKLAEEFKKSLLSMPTTKVPNAAKMPKPKAMPKVTDKPSKFFKSEIEEFNIKHPTLMKLRDFLLKKHKINKINKL